MKGELLVKGISGKRNKRTCPLQGLRQEEEEGKKRGKSSVEASFERRKDEGGYITTPHEVGLRENPEVQVVKSISLSRGGEGDMNCQSGRPSEGTPHTEPPLTAGRMFRAHPPPSCVPIKVRHPLGLVKPRDLLQSDLGGRLVVEEKGDRVMNQVQGRLVGLTKKKPKRSGGEKGVGGTRVGQRWQRLPYLSPSIN